MSILRITRERLTLVCWSVRRTVDDSGQGRRQEAPALPYSHELTVEEMCSTRQNQHILLGYFLVV